MTEKNSQKRRAWIQFTSLKHSTKTTLKFSKTNTYTQTGRNKQRRWKQVLEDSKQCFWTLKLSWWKMQRQFSKSKFWLELMRKIRKFSQFCLRSRKMKREKKLGTFCDYLGSSRKFKTKSRILATSYKRYPRTKLNITKTSKLMETCRQNTVMGSWSTSSATKIQCLGWYQA